MGSTSDGVRHSVRIPLLLLIGFLGLVVPNCSPAAEATELDIPSHPRISISDVSIKEGNNSSNFASFVVSLSESLPTALDLEIRTEGIAAHPGQDFVPRAERIVVPPGTVRFPVAVLVLSDQIAEAAETFALVVRHTGTSVDPRELRATATIQADEPPILRILDASVVEGTGDWTVVRIPVVLSRESSLEIAADCIATSGSATAGEDFEDTRGRVVITPYHREGFVEWRVRADRLTEDNEEFTVQLVEPINAVASDHVGRVRILEDDGMPQTILEDTSISEGAEPPATVDFAVRLSNPSSRPVSLAYHTRAGSAAEGRDYQPRQGTLEFPPGQTEAVVRVPIVNDSIAEAEEDFALVLESPRNVVLTDAEARAVILDDDLTPVITLMPALAQEGAPGEDRALEFEVRLSSPPRETVTVNYETEAGTATPDADYRSTSGKLSFLVLEGGLVVHRIRVPLMGDADIEPNETMTLRLKQPNNAFLANASATGTILNDDGPTLRINDTMSIEPPLGTTQAAVTVELSGSTSLPVAVSYFTVNATAIAGSDFTATSGWLLFPPGTTQQTILVPIRADRLIEPSESFRIQLTSPSGATLSQGTAEVVIHDQGLPSLRIDPVSVPEGSDRPSVARFQVRLSSIQTSPVRVRYRTIGSTATPALDFVETSGELEFVPGSTLALASIPIVADDIPETNEVFFVALDQPVNATIDVARAAATIVDDDDIPLISIEDVWATECGEDEASAIFSLSLSKPSPAFVSVPVVTQSGTATAGSDFEFVQTLATFVPGSLRAEVRVPIVCDGIDEPDETFRLLLGPPENALLERTSATATLIDLDTATIRIGDASKQETEASDTLARIPVELSSPSAEPVVIFFVTHPVTATSNEDYSETKGWIVIPPGLTRQSIEIPVLRDGISEGPESFLVQIVDVSGARLANREATVTIVDDDQPTLSFVNTSPHQANESDGRVRLSVRLSRASSFPIDFTYSISPGSADPAKDYLPTADTLTLMPGIVETTIDILLVNDDITEQDEDFTVWLTSANLAAIGEGDARVTIHDDDAPPLPQLKVEDASVREGNSGWTTLSLGITLSTASKQLVSVNVSMQGETATPGLDFLSQNFRVTFPPGVTRRTVELTIVGDVKPELDETFLVSLADPIQTTLGRSSCRITIQDDEPKTNNAPSVEWASPESGTRLELGEALDLGVSASDPDGDPIAVEFQVDGRTLMRLESPPFRAQWAPAQEGSYNLSAIASDPAGSTRATPPRNITVVARPSLTALDTVVTESEGIATSTLRLSHPSLYPLSVRATTLEETALGNSDFLPLDVEFVVPAGELEGSIRLTLVDDLVHEPVESLGIQFAARFGTNSEAATLHLAARVQIIDDDPENKPNEPPTVTLIRPRIRDLFDLKEPITFETAVIDPEGPVERVQFFAGETMIAEIREAPFTFSWTNAPPGDHSVWARVFDPQQATSESRPVRIAVIRPCGHAVLVRETSDFVAQRLQDYAFELGVSMTAVDRENAVEVLANNTSADLIVWNHDSLKPWTKSEIRLFLALDRSGVSMFWIGDHLTDLAPDVDDGLREAWIRLLQLRPIADVNSAPHVEVGPEPIHPGPRHQVIDGIAGWIPSFDLPRPPAGGVDAGLEGGHLLATAGETAVLIAGEFQNPQRRSLTQAFPVVSESIIQDDPASVETRKRLFQNGVAWLLNCPICRDLDVAPWVTLDPPFPRPGQTILVSLHAWLLGNCTPLGTKVHCQLPPGLSFLDATLTQGEWTTDDHGITFDLGRLIPNSEVTLTWSARVESSGLHTTFVRWETLNERPETTADNTIVVWVQAIEGLSLNAHLSSGSSTLDLEVRGHPGLTCWIETAPSPTGPWETLARVSLDPAQARLALPLSAGMTSGFYRARE